MDILQPLPIEKWPFLREMTKKNWPTYAYYYNWISNAMKWKKKDPEFKINIYCPNGNHDSGVFVGLFTTALNVIALFTLEQSKDVLKKVLLETNLIDWSQKTMLFSAMHEDFSDVLLTVLKEKNLEFSSNVTCNYFKPKEECVNIEFQVPDECKLGYLDPSHVEIIHPIWPHRSEKYPELSMTQLRTYITANKGIGLFLKKDNTLVSWILETEWGGLGMLQTLEEHKRKGYAKVVTQAMIKEIAKEENLDSVLFIIDTNTSSKRLFESLGFTVHAKNTWVLIEN